LAATVKSDREKWEQRYGSGAGALPAPDALLVASTGLLRSGRALDLACGRGANALFLAEHDYQVDAADISLTALQELQSEARRRRVDVACVAVDLDHFPLPAALYDVVMVFYFFSEPLIPSIKASLKPGGMLLYATYNVGHTRVKPGFNPAYLIEPDALSRHFADLEKILHEPHVGEHGNVSRLVARQPSR
jgi:tellurite methyltransferase